MAPRPKDSNRATDARISISTRSRPSSLQRAPRRQPPCPSTRSASPSSADGHTRPLARSLEEHGPIAQASASRAPENPRRVGQERRLRCANGGRGVAQRPAASRRGKDIAAWTEATGPSLLRRLPGQARALGSKFKIGYQSGSRWPWRPHPRCSGSLPARRRGAASVEKTKEGAWTEVRGSPSRLSSSESDSKPADQIVKISCRSSCRRRRRGRWPPR